jgi:hypothetical protein
MSGPSDRCGRILRVREIEHRVAAARQAAAERRVADLHEVARRIGMLRSSLGTSEGEIDGQSLKAMSEMVSRLGKAEGDLSRPIGEAEAIRERASVVRLAARTREDGASRLQEKAAAREAGAATVREDAERIHRIASRRHA